jgi:hypothetical protein
VVSKLCRKVNKISSNVNIKDPRRILSFGLWTRFIVTPSREC